MVYRLNIYIWNWKTFEMWILIRLLLEASDLKGALGVIHTSTSIYLGLNNPRLFKKQTKNKTKKTKQNKKSK